MRFDRSRSPLWGFLVSAVAIGVLAGCAGQSTLAPPPANLGSTHTLGRLGTGVPTVAVPDATPPVCKGQKKTKQYASANETLSAKGGSLCIPQFSVFGGTLRYPGASPSGKAALTSSTTDYANVPLPKSSGTPLFYLNLAPTSATTFGATVKAGGGLTGSKIKAKSAYTAYLDGYKFGFWYAINSCYAVAQSGKFGGVIGGVGTLLMSQSGYSAYEIFIYAGQYGGTKC